MTDSHSMAYPLPVEIITGTVYKTLLFTISIAAVTATAKTCEVLFSLFDMTFV